MSLGGGEIVIGLIILLVLFGGSQIPKLARNLGKAQNEFKTGLDEGKSESTSTPSSTTTTDTTATATPSTPADPPRRDGATS